MEPLRHAVAICGKSPKLHQSAAEFYADRPGVRIVRIADYETAMLISGRSDTRLEYVQAQISSVSDEPSLDPVVILDLRNDDEVSEVTTTFPAAVVVELFEPSDSSPDDFDISLMDFETIRAHQVACINDSVMHSFLDSLLLTHPNHGA